MQDVDRYMNRRSLGYSLYAEAAFHSKKKSKAIREKRRPSCYRILVTLCNRLIALIRLELF